MVWNRWIVVYVLSLIAFLAVDLLWLGMIARDFYQDRLDALMRDTVNWPVAIGFYALYVVGILILAVRPSYFAFSARRAAWLGAVFGLMAYGTYDLTNLAVLEGYPPVVALVDVAWGTVLTSLTATIGYLLADRLIPGVSAYAGSRPTTPL